MAKVSVESESIEVPSQYMEGVITGKLLSYVQCPRCQTALRIMAAFDDEEQAEAACQELDNQMGKLMWERSVETVVGTATYMGMRGASPHGTRYRYGSAPDACMYFPYYGTERELAKEVWDRLSHLTEDLEMPSGPVKMTLFEDVKYVQDQLGRLPALLIYNRRFLEQPVEAVIGKDLWRMSWDEAQESRKQAPERFLRMIQGNTE